MSSGRYVRVGLTWKSATIALAAIVVAMLALGAFLERVQTELRLDVSILDDRVVEIDGSCTWEIDLEVHNSSDRALSLVSVRLDDLAGSERGIVGAVAPAESIVRTYSYALPDCAIDPRAVGADSLVVEFKPPVSTALRSVTVPID